MGYPTNIIADYQQASCFCTDARLEFADCEGCLQTDHYYNNNGDESNQSRVLRFYIWDCTGLGFHANESLAYPSTTRETMPSATIPPDLWASTASPEPNIREACDELCGVINGQIHECNLTPLDTNKPMVSRVPSPDLDYYASLLLNRTAAECACTMPVLRRMYGCWKCWFDEGGAPSPFLLLDYNIECNDMGYWSDTKFIVVQEDEETHTTSAPTPTVSDPFKDAVSGPLKPPGSGLLALLLLIFL
ncbi:hypothetical protein VTH82DRAFT_5663 [Thermothelomyces myriococcoides]